MRFISMIKAGKDSEAGAPPDPRLIAAIGQLSEEMARAGVLLASEGLLPSSKGARIHASGGKLTVTDGPFSEAKELIGGYAILEAKSKAEAIELGKRFMKVHQDILGPAWEGDLEIRQLFDAADFAPKSLDAVSAGEAG
jgi:hypothetical protein